MNKFAVVVNTNSAYSDLWPMFFGQLEKFFPNQKVYVFTDRSDGLPENVSVITYNPSLSFKEQYLSCIEKVYEEVLFYLNDDYILYDKVNFEKVNELVDTLLNNDDLSFIRFTRGSNFSENKIGENLYLLDENEPDYFSQTASLWKTKDLSDLYTLCNSSHIAGDKGVQLETLADSCCRIYGFTGAVYYDGEPKRGIVHYDSKIFPYIASALVRKKWNLHEYSKELFPLLYHYEINANERGIYGGF